MRFLVLSLFLLSALVAAAGAQEVKYSDEKIVVIPPEQKSAEWRSYAGPCELEVDWSVDATTEVVRFLISVAVAELPAGHRMYVVLSDPAGTKGTKLRFTDVFAKGPDYRDRGWSVTAGKVELPLNKRPTLQDDELVEICADLLILDETGNSVKSSTDSRCSTSCPVTIEGFAPKSGLIPDLNTSLIIGP